MGYKLLSNCRIRVGYDSKGKLVYHPEFRGRKWFGRFAVWKPFRTFGIRVVCLSEEEARNFIAKKTREFPETVYKGVDVDGK